MFVFDKSITSFCLSPDGCTDHMNNPPGFLPPAQCAANWEDSWPHSHKFGALQQQTTPNSGYSTGQA